MGAEMESRIIRSAYRRVRCPQCTPQPFIVPRILFQGRHTSTQTEQQANPLGDYYESILLQTLPKITSATHQPTTSSPSISIPKTDKEETLAKARVVFGSRLAGPAERRSELEKKSTLIAGVLVPPRPEEPDNCCMSGCVNCVWDRYGEEVEQWAKARRAADENLRKESGGGKGGTRSIESGTRLMLGEVENGAQHTMISMDDDGGGSETNWDVSLNSSLFKNIPVGILEFMKQEKRLKEKHAREGTTG